MSRIVGSDKYGKVVGFLVLVVESVFKWDIESFVDLCFDIVSFVLSLLCSQRNSKSSSVRCLKLSMVAQTRQILSARLYGIDFLCGWSGKMSLTDIGECQWI